MNDKKNKSSFSSEEIAGEFAGFSGNTQGIEQTAHLQVGTEDDLVRILEKENEAGLEDNIGSVNATPSEEAAVAEREADARQDDILDLQCKIGRGYEMKRSLKEYISGFYESHPECDAWKEAKKVLNKVKSEADVLSARGKALGINPHSSIQDLWKKAGYDGEQGFWKTHRDEWLACKKTWETPYGQNVSIAFERLGNVQARLMQRFDEIQALDVSKVEWGKIFALATEQLMRYFTITGDVHWSQEHLSEAERWYALQDVDPVRAQQEFLAQKDLWGDLL